LSADQALDAEALLEVLTGAGVSFILIGGLALGAHGEVRATKDLDIVPEPDRENFERLVEVLDRLDYEIPGMNEFNPNEVVQPTVDALEAGGSWVLATRYGRLDILQFVDPELDYERLAAGAMWTEVFGQRVRVCGYEDLVAMKEAAGRPQDAVDLQRLREARGE
jgi:hypothetical protein